jgi:glycosyltransferase involved in cell wall biosynthesis
VNPARAESFPYGILEAMSLGCPCVVTDAGGSAEAIVDGDSGLVVAVRDPAALAAATLRLLADRDLARHFGAAAAERVRERFTRAQMVNGTLGVYGGVMRG